MTGMTEMNKAIIDEFRANGGKVGGNFEGVPLLLLHTVGAKSGLPRTNPLAYFTDGDDLVIVASYAGAPNNPPWFHNLKARPDVEVEVGEEKFAVRAEIIGEPIRTEMYKKLGEAAPTFAEYQMKTTRRIPLIRLKRTGF